MSRNRIEQQVNEFIKLHRPSNKKVSHSDTNRDFIILSGISGSGKSTIGKVLEEQHGFMKFRNVYTRKRREVETETDGTFVRYETFKKWKDSGELLIAKQTNGVWHGIRTDELDRLAPGNRIWADKSVSSLLKLGSIFWGNAHMIYVLPPDFETLVNRLNHRERSTASRLSDLEITARLDEEVREMFDSTQLPYQYVLNESVESAIAEIMS